MSSAAVSTSGIVTQNSLDEVLTAQPVPPQLAQQVETQDGSRAVEVAAMFDGAVLEVRHFDNPAGGKLTTLTKVLLGTAAAALLGTFTLFADSYSQVAAEKAADSKLEQSGGSTIHRPHSSGRGRDGAAGGLLFYGLGALLYGLSRAGSERRENQFTIGSAPGATFQVDSEGLPEPKFPLLRSTGAEYEFLFTDRMSGELTVNGKSTPLSELRSQAQPVASLNGTVALTIPDGARISLAHQGCNFLIRSVARARHYPVPLNIDWRAQSYTGAVVAGAAGFLGLMFAAPPDAHSLALDGFTNQQLINYMVKAPEVKDETPEWLKKVEQPKSTSPAPSSTRSRELPTPSRYVLRTPAASSKSVTKEEAKQNAVLIARQSGVLGFLTSSSLIGSITGGAALGNGAEEAMNGLEGINASDAYGTPTGSLVGTGPGGIPGDGPIGVGPMGTGKLPGGRSIPNAALKRHVVGAPEPSVGPVEVIGGIPKDVVRRVIRGHMNEVKFCYEKELTRDAGLSGRMVVKFAINGMGNVANSFVESSTLRNPTAEQCIAGAVRRWVFPKPQGGVVIVSYPFILKSSTGE